MSFFDRAAAYIARLMGHPSAFALACLVILTWGAAGPFLGFSDTWQLAINTSTTIVTFLMVFLIQNTQSRDSHALHLKIDELLRALDAADTRLVDVEERSEQELERLREHYEALAVDPAENGETAGVNRQRQSCRPADSEPILAQPRSRPTKLGGKCHAWDNSADHSDSAADRRRASLAV